MKQCSHEECVPIATATTIVDRSDFVTSMADSQLLSSGFIQQIQSNNKYLDWSYIYFEVVHNV